MQAFMVILMPGPVSLPGTVSQPIGQEQFAVDTQVISAMAQEL